MKEKKILVVIKEPGQAPKVEPLFDNTLEAFQKAVGGWIETVTLAADLVLIVNDAGWLRGLPFNVNLCGFNLAGTVIAASVDGDEFASIKASKIPAVMRLMDQ